jgi:hypothetical protein
MPGDPGSHLQFQISLLRLMEQKWTGHKVTGKKAPGQTTHQKAASKAGPSVQVEELERLQHSRPDKVRLRARS